MYMMSAHFLQSRGANGGQKLLGRAVIEFRRRLGGRVIQFDVDRMTLVGSDLQAIVAEGKSLLVVLLDDRCQLFAR